MALACLMKLVDKKERERKKKEQRKEFTGEEECESFSTAGFGFLSSAGGGLI